MEYKEYQYPDVDKIMVVIVSVIMITFVGWMLTAKTTDSMSGSMKVLRMNGEVEKTRIYDMDTLYYAPNKGHLSKLEVDAIHTLSGEFIISINE